MTRANDTMVSPPHASDIADPIRSPFIRAPETSRSIIIVTLIAALAPLGAGVVFFGWRAVQVAMLAVAGCVVCEWAYTHAVRMPAMRYRSHALLTGVLLALTLPAWAPWYVPLVAALFATIVGKAIFGGVGHFLWQPALVGRLAVAVLFATPLTTPFESHPQTQPVLSPNHIIVGDVMEARRVRSDLEWRQVSVPLGADAMLVKPPAELLSGLTRGDKPEYSALMDVPVWQEPDADVGPGAAPSGIARAKPAALMKLPPIKDLLVGARPGGIGETSAIVIIVAGLYLIFRNYIKWSLPAAFLFSAGAIAAFAPISLAGAGGNAIWGWGPEGGWSFMNALPFGSHWTLPPLLREGLSTGLLYVCYQILSGPILLAAFFLANEMTSRPVTAGGQVIFGLGAGTIAMLLQLYADLPIPAYMAVLIMNTFTPTIDALWRPRVFGRRRLAWLR